MTERRGSVVTYTRGTVSNEHLVEQSFFTSLGPTQSWILESAFPMARVMEAKKALWVEDEGYGSPVKSWEELRNGMPYARILHAAMRC